MYKIIAKTQVCLIALMLTIGSVVQAEDKESDDHGQTEGPEQDSQSQFTIFGLPLLAKDGSLTAGLGVSISDSPIKGIESNSGIFPQITYQNGNFFVDTSLIGYSVYSNEVLTCTLLGNLHLPEYDVEDSTYLKGIDEKDVAVEVGGALTLTTLAGDVGFAVLSDVSNNHKGQLVNVKFSLPMGTDNWKIEPIAGVRWQSNNMTNYYYGVKRKEMKEDRPAYSADSTFIPYLGLNGAVKLSESFFLQASVQYEKLGSGISDSPLIEEDNVFSGSISLNYIFF